MTNSKNLNELTSKKLRHKMKIQHTNELDRNDSRIDLKTENKTKISLLWQWHLIDLLQSIYNVYLHENIISNFEHFTEGSHKNSAHNDHIIALDKFGIESLLYHFLHFWFYALQLLAALIP